MREYAEEYSENDVPHLHNCQTRDVVQIVSQPTINIHINVIIIHGQNRSSDRVKIVTNAEIFGVNQHGIPMQSIAKSATQAIL